MMLPASYSVVRPGFAVIDFETTGLWPEGSDRAIEVAVVVTDETGHAVDRHDTLIHVDRDLGAQRIHRISAADLIDAPTFAEVAPALTDLLRGHVIVAHNAAFDTRFLCAEYGRLGFEVPAHYQDAVCTMRLANWFHMGARSLAECCDVFDIGLEGAHRASVDAWATAQLLEAYISSSPAAFSAFWQEHLESASRAAWPDFADAERPTHNWLPRPEHEAAAPHFLERISAQLPDVATDDAERDYLALLDRCLLDRRLSAHEQNALIAFAAECGLERGTCRGLHERYLDALVVAAWADGILTEDERADIEAVAQLLAVEVPDLDRHAPADNSDSPVIAESNSGVGGSTSGFALTPGDRVCLTGQMRRERTEWERVLAASGVVSWPTVTKKVKLLIAADPDSMSGKAQHARKLGIPIVDEGWLEKNFS
jgi:DNA polymerase-3 subunit epsilon